MHDLELSPSQMAIWTGQKIDPETPMYNMAMTFLIEGRLNVHRFRKAFSHLVQTADALRTVFIENDGVPSQSVLASVPYQIHEVDFLTQADPHRAADLWVTDRCRQHFDLSRCLFDTALLKLAEDRNIWYFCQHHLTTDAESFALLFKRVADTYKELEHSEAILYPDSPRFSSHIRKIKDEQTDEAAATFWKQKATNLSPQAGLYGQRVRKAATASERCSVDLGLKRSQQFRAMATQTQPSVFSNQLACFNAAATLLAAYIHRVSGQRRLCIGLPLHNRVSPASKETLGLFVEFFPLVIEVDEDDSFASLLRKTNASVVQVLRHAEPGSVDRRLKKNYNVVLNYLSASFPDFAGLPTTCKWLHSGCSDRGHDLRLQVHDFAARGTLCLDFDFKVEAFGEQKRIDAAEHFTTLWDAMLRDVETPIQTLDIRSQRELEENDSINCSLTSHVPQASILDDFQRQVRKQPLADAILFRGRSYSYQWLDERATKLVEAMRSKGVQPGSNVAVCLRRCPDTVAAVLAVMKSGAAYVPIDPTYPASRIEYMLLDSRAVAVVTDSESADRVPAGVSTISVQNITGEAKQGHETSENFVLNPEDAAYVMYTSGSTGKPKGVVISHRALANYVGWARKMYVDQVGMTFPFFTSFAFDLTNTSIFVPLASGGRIAIYPESEGGIDLTLSDVLRENLVDIIKLTPSHLVLLRNLDLHDSRVRQLIVGGEDLKSEVAMQVSNAFGNDIIIHNEYGPTEATVGCVIHTYCRERDIDQSVPIGKPIDNIQVSVLNEQLVPVPDGVEGELYVSGVSVSNGYWNRPDLTAERMIKDPYQPGRLMYRTGDRVRRLRGGDLVCLGRVDDQVKIRGARIELAEVEAAITNHPDIESCVVSVTQQTKEEDNCDVTYCVSCGLPSNYPGTTLDESGKCHLCRGFQSYQDKVQKYFRTIDDLRKVFAESEKSTDAAYDCLALLSGGKDSTYALCQLVDMGLKVLSFTLDNGYISEEAKLNIQRVVDRLGVDHVFGTTDSMNEIFVDSLQRHSNVCHGCFKTIYTLSVNLAHEKGIRNIVTGLSRGQFFETRLTEDLFTNSEQDVDTIDQLILDARKAYHRVDDMVSQRLDVDIFQNDAVFEEIQFIDFYRYCDVSLQEMLSYLEHRVPWIRPTDTGRSTNCLINDVGIFVHKRERGFHNYAFPYSWDVRVGHKTREETLTELNDDIDEERVQKILDEIGYEAAPSVSGEQLVAYCVTEQEINVGELREHLQQQLPSFMIPSQFLPLTEIPLTPNGKVDRAALPSLFSNAAARHTNYVAPHTDVEKQLAKIWSSFLQVKEIGAEDNFFMLGGESLAAIQIVSSANQADLTLTANDLFQHPTISKLAAIVESRQTPPVNQPKTAFIPGPTTSRIEDTYGLTPLQEGILFHTLESTQTDIYVSQLSCQLQSGVEIDAFRPAWQATIDRHPALRTTFTCEDLKSPKQVVHSQVSLPWRTLDKRTAPPDTISWEELLNDERKMGFDVTQAPLMRFALIRTHDETYKFVWTIHHLLADAWSANLVLKEVTANYETLREGGAIKALPAPPHSRLIAWLRDCTFEARDEFWSDRLKPFIKATPLGIDCRCDGEGHYRVIKQLPDVMLGDAARRVGLTANTLLMGAWAIVLSRLSGDQGVLFGTTVAGRPPTIEGIDKMVGLCINTLPTSVSVDATAELVDWLSAFQRDLAAEREHQHFPLARIQRLTSMPVGVPIFESLVVWESVSHSHGLDIGEQGLFSDVVTVENPSNVPLVILGEQTSYRSLKLTVLGNKSRFDERSVGRIAGYVNDTLKSILHLIQSDSSIVGQVETISEAERVELTHQSYGRDPDESAEPVTKVWLNWFDKALRERPHRPAVRCGESSLSYEDLDTRSRVLSARICELDVTPGSLIGICAERSVDAIVGILAIHRAACGYVPLDISYPLNRLQWMTLDSGLEYVLTTGKQANKIASQLQGVRTIKIEEVNGDCSRSSKKERHVSPNHAAYAIYTSGSTGQPSGVRVNHKNLAFSTAARFDVYKENVDSFLLLSNLGFDSSIAGIFWTLSQGGTLIIPEEQHHWDPGELAGLIKRLGVTHTLTVPTFYRHILDQPKKYLRSLRSVIVAGETCPASLVQSHRAMLPSTNLYNEYGPTETSVWCTVADCLNTTVKDRVPIGKPIPGVQIYLVDKQLKLVPSGAAGEIVIGGPGVTTGYLNKPELTASRFIPDPFGMDSEGLLYRSGDIGRMREDGLIEFHGRQDHQISVRGHRIELGEIERALLEYPEVGETAVFTQAEGEFAPSVEVLVEALQTQSSEEAERMLQIVEHSAPPADKDDTQLDLEQGQRVINRQQDAFEMTVKLQDDFIRPPRTEQREWLLRRTIDEWVDDLKSLDEVSCRFAMGREFGSDSILTQEQTNWSEPKQIMEDWQLPIMRGMAEAVTHAGGDVLEIGFGRGASATMIQKLGVRSHTVVEVSDECIQQYYEPWKQRFSDRDVRLLRGRWQELIPSFTQYDGILFHAVPLNEDELLQDMVQGINFAAPFFPVASTNLKPGGVFTYLSTEIDSLARRHQRLLFQYFKTVTTEMVQLEVPQNTLDSWWADSMVIVQAYKG